MKKRPIPAPNAQQVLINTAVKERLEIIGGERGGAIKPLPPGATLEQIVAKINEILEIMQ